MKYMFLIYGDEQAWATLTAGERDAFDRACRASDEALETSGHVLAAQRLHGSSTATTVRVQDGRMALADGPFAGTREQIVGLFVVEARDLNEAIRVASTMPQARRGPIEIRPILQRGRGE